MIECIGSVLMPDPCRRPWQHVVSRTERQGVQAAVTIRSRGVFRGMDRDGFGKSQQPRKWARIEVNGQ